MKSSAFSLIELMVVIAIVGVLAATGVSVYRHYAYAARIDSIMPAMDSLVEQAIVYSQQNGQFPTPNLIGLGTSSDSNCTYCADDTLAAQVIGPYYEPTPIGGLQMVDQSQNYANKANCGAVGTISVVLNDQKLEEAGYSTFGGDVTVQCDMWHTGNGVIGKFCYYYGPFSFFGTPNTSELIPGLYNYADPNTWTLTADPLVGNNPATVVCQ